ncbi:MAG TPA: hypothetical protein VGB68_12090 [Pyrinomonadaceae bacterium]|jgi:hypothetical protein
MTENKQWYFYLWVIAGLLCAGNALQYLIGGQPYINSNLRNTLVIIQLLLGVATIVYGYKAYGKRTVRK